MCDLLGPDVHVADVLRGVGGVGGCCVCAGRHLRQMGGLMQESR